MILFPSGSVAVTLRPTAVPAAEFSATERVALAPSLNTGARLAGVPPPPKLGLRTLRPGQSDEHSRG